MVRYVSNEPSVQDQNVPTNGDRLVFGIHIGFWQPFWIGTSCFVFNNIFL